MSHRFAVIGNPIAHSLSPIIHECFAKQANINLIYEKIKAEDHTVASVIADFFSQNGKGLNVTVPFKQRAFALASHYTERCKLAGAANTLWMQDNLLHADNTDGIGFIRDLSRFVSLTNQRVLLLGAGGAARGIIQPLLENNPACLIVTNRTLAKVTALQTVFPTLKSISMDEPAESFDLIINATSASLTGACINLPASWMASKPFCYDLSYKQHETTAFVRYARDLGCDAVDGIGMLVEQAAESFFIWNNFYPSTTEVLHEIRTIQKK